MVVITRLKIAQYVKSIKVMIFSDSRLVVSQINGYEAKKGQKTEYFSCVKNLI